jgi:hypothetical protein
MTTSKTFVFCEGPTDQVIFSALKKALPQVQVPQPISVNGKRNFRTKILDSVEPELTAGEPGCHINLLVFRDQDADEQAPAIRDAFEGIARELLGQWQLRPGFDPVLAWPNLFRLDEPPTSERPGLRLVLHIADPPCPEDLTLRNLTTDSYVLALALRDQVLGRFADEINSSIDILRQLATLTVPGAISGQGITFDQDKDFLAAYLCVSRFWPVKRTEEKERLLRVILDRALKHAPDEFWSVFASWRTAIEEAAR